jgi:hypothetical protein
VLSELVTALEHDGQHARAVAVLEEHGSVMQWLHRFQYVYNALMAGNLEKAAEGFGRLPEPEDAAWTPLREKVRRMLARAGSARAVTSLDGQDLRGWHYVLTGGVLGSLSPYGFDVGMAGRWAYLGDSVEGCAAALQRLTLILDAADAAPESVALLPDRSSRILGAAAAGTLGLPATDFDPAKPAAHSLVVAYDLTETEPSAVAALRERAPGQILFERATCWTDPPRITADVSGLLGQTVVPPWAAQIRRLEGGTATVHTSWMPRSCRSSDVDGASMSYRWSRDGRWDRNHQSRERCGNTKAPRVLPGPSTRLLIRRRRGAGGAGVTVGA